MITNVGRAHLQGFGSFEGVKKTKGELYDYLAANDALVFINADNEHLMQMAEQRNINRLITYGKDENCDVWGGSHLLRSIPEVPLAHREFRLA